MTILIVTIISSVVGICIYLAYLIWQKWLIMYKFLQRENQGLYSQLRECRRDLSLLRKDYDDLKTRVQGKTS
jgi:hypothetical protein